MLFVKKKILFNKNSAIVHVKNVLKIGTKKFFIKSLSMLGSPEPGFCNFILILFLIIISLILTIA